MRILEQDNREILIGGGKQMMFGIDSDTSIIFDILRNKMYSNKIGAVAREIASNSRDANREAGTDKPIEIEFSDNNVWLGGNLSLIFRDYGIGISPDRMENIFMKYAASTKRDSNTQTGGFGLGAKTPFAYTDSFIVRTVADYEEPIIEESEVVGYKPMTRKEYVYNAIIDATGKGKMVLVYEDFTTKPSGTEIIIPIVSNDDRLRFEDEIYRATGYWDNVEYVNFRTRKSVVEEVAEGENFKMTRYNGWASIVGLLDGIPYEIKPSRDRNALVGYTVILNLNVGEVTINANRESLQYDEKTQTCINDKYDVFTQELTAQVENYMADNTTYKDAYKKYTSLRRKDTSKTPFEKLVYDLKESKKLDIDFDVKYNDEVVTYLKFKYHSIQELTWDSWSDKTTYKDSPLDISHKLVYMDKGRISVAKNEELGNFILIKPIKGNPATLLQEEIDKLNELTNGEYINYSEVKVENERITEKYEKRDYLTLKVRNSNRRPQDIYFDKKTKKIRTKDNVLFAPVDSISKSSLYLDYHKTTIVEYLFKETEIFFINESQYLKHLKPNGFKTFDEAWSEIDLSLFSDIVEANSINDTIDEVEPIIKDNFPEILPKGYQKLFNKTSEIPSELSGVDWNWLGVPKSKFDYEGLSKKYFKTMQEKYPMLLPYLRCSRDNEERKINVIKDYISKI